MSETQETINQDFNIISEHDMSNDIGELAKALCNAQSELESVEKGEKGYGYNYASLASTIEVSKPVLKKHGLAVSQLVGNRGNRPSITTILMHTSGQYIKSTADMVLIDMKGVNEAQRAGAVYSYLRRYALQAILNMASEDTDASSKGKYDNKTSFSKDKKESSSTKEAKPKRKFQRKPKAATEVEHEI